MDENVESEYKLPDTFPSISSSFTIRQCPLERIQFLLKNIKTTSVANNQIPAGILTMMATELAKPLKHIIDLCISESIYPSRLKLYRVIPLYKSGERVLVENYRPVSIVAPISKVFEHVIFDQVQEYIDQNNIISKSQYGFRSGYSIAIPIVKMTNRIKRFRKGSDYDTTGFEKGV
jgi:hypothetical protein